MYARTNYPPSEDPVPLPPNYSGTALQGDPREDASSQSPVENTENYIETMAPPPPGRNPWDAPPPPPPPSAGRPPFLHIPFSSLFGKIPTLFGSEKSESPVFCGKDGEDMLLLVAALILFFSDKGDKTGALILFALLFI